METMKDLNEVLDEMGANQQAKSLFNAAAKAIENQTKLANAAESAAKSFARLVDLIGYKWFGEKGSEIKHGSTIL